MPRRTVGVALLAFAFAAAAIGFMLWAKASRDADRADIRVFSRTEEKAPDRAPAIGAWSAGGLLFLSGVIVLATAPTDR